MNALTFPKREPKRSRVFLSAQVDAGSGSMPVRIRDISRTGALLESDFAPKGGDTLELTCGTTVLRARVAWADRGWFGVEFFTPLVIGDLVDAAGTKLAVSAPRTYHRSERLDS
jgi:hypothetical protein